MSLLLLTALDLKADAE